MSIHDHWDKALHQTQIIRSRVKGLMTFADTHVPYVLLSASSVNPGDTVVRKGKVLVTKPSLVLPPNIPQFYGFDFDAENHLSEQLLTSFLMVRGIQMPSLKYNNELYAVDVHEGDVARAVGFFRDNLERAEDVQTGLLTGPEDCWQFSLLIYISLQVARNADTDIRGLLDKFRDPSA